MKHSRLRIYIKDSRVFYHLSKHLEVCKKYSATRRIFNCLLGVCKHRYHGIKHSLECLIPSTIGLPLIKINK